MGLPAGGQQDPKGIDLEINQEEAERTPGDSRNPSIKQHSLSAASAHKLSGIRETGKTSPTRNCFLCM